MGLRNRKRQIDNLRGDLEEALAEHQDARDPEEFRRYADDPVGFVREVLDEEPMEWQEEALNDLLTHSQIAVQSGHAMGKDWLGSRAALWWLLAREGMALVTSPTARQLRHIFFSEIGEVWNAHDDLPGTLFKESLEVGPKNKILAMTSTAASNLTGFHAEGGVLAIISEAQGVGTEGWTGFFSNTVSEEDTVLALGNPLEPAGEFHNACGSEEWKTYKLSVFDHPNVVEDEQIIPGGPSRIWLNRMREQWGEESRKWKSRVLGEFPESAEDSLYLAPWIDDAMNYHESGPLDDVAEQGRTVVAVDPAGRGPDRTAIAVRRGPKVEEIRTYDHTTQPQLRDKVRAALDDYGVKPVEEMRAEAEEKDDEIDPDNYPLVVVDATGMGGPLFDELEAEGYNVAAFMAGENAAEKSRFANRRAEASWKLRQKLEAGAIALPPEADLREELLAVQWGEDAKGRVRIPKKSKTRERIGRSPDKADAVTMAYFGENLDASHGWLLLFDGETV